MLGGGWRETGQLNLNMPNPFVLGGDKPPPEVFGSGLFSSPY